MEIFNNRVKFAVGGMIILSHQGLVVDDSELQHHGRVTLATEEVQVFLVLITWGGFRMTLPATSTTKELGADFMNKNL